MSMFVFTLQCGLFYAHRVVGFMHLYIWHRAGMGQELPMHELPPHAQFPPLSKACPEIHATHPPPL